jgi:hypothetical protein
VKSTKYLIIIILLVLALIASVFVVIRTTTTYQRATTSTTSIVLENSYLFASPLQAKAGEESLPADRREKVRITIFLLDGRGLGVANQTVTLNLPKNITIQNQQEITDSTGKAIFDLSSSTAQTVNITATVGNSHLPQSVKIVFY